MKKIASYDQGKTFKESQDMVFFGTFFFVATERMAHSRDAFTVIDLYSKIGGLTAIIFLGLSVFGVNINIEELRAKLVS